MSLVAFTMVDVRFAPPGRVGAWVSRPFWPVRFLNVRTYVRCGDETGIYFLAEYLPSRLTVLLEPAMFGLPYCFGRSQYEHERGALRGRVSAASGGRGLMLAYRCDDCPREGFAPCRADSLDEFLMERYVAFTDHGRSGRRMFRVWHEPWRQRPINIAIDDDSILLSPGAIDLTGAQVVGGNYSPGVEAWVGLPQRCRG